MQFVISRFFIPFLVVLVFLFSPGCRSNAAGGNYAFYYYPSLNLYYDKANNSFMYTLDGGTNWMKRTPESKELPDNIAERVEIVSDTPDPWIHNSAHRIKYNGVSSDFKPVEDQEEVQRMKQTGNKKTGRKSPSLWPPSAKVAGIDSVSTEIPEDNMDEAKDTYQVDSSATRENDFQISGRE